MCPVVNEPAIFRNYQLVEKLSQNDLCQSWSAINRRTGKPCFVKRPNPASDLSGIEQRDVMATSMALQKRVRSRQILTSVETHREQDNLFVEYPLLDQDVWQPASRLGSFDQLLELLPRMAVVIDYLHSLDLVHCDLKLANFLVRESGASSQMVLIDLDFLSPAGAKPEGLIIGTPSLIPPEINTGQRIQVQSDIFSIAASIRDFLDHSDAGDSSSPQRIALDNLLDRMMIDDPYQRPRFLAEALKRYEVIDEETLDRANRRLLAMQLLGAYRSLSIKDRAEPFILDLARSVRMHGLSEEFIADLEIVSRTSIARAYYLLKDLLEPVELDHTAGFWHVRPSDNQSRTAYWRMRRLTKPELAKEESIEQADVRALLRQSDQFATAGEYEKSFLWGHTAYQAVADQLPHPELNLDDLDNFAAVASRLGHLEISTAVRKRRLELSNPLEFRHAENIRLLARELLILQDYDGARKWIDEGLEVTSKGSDDTFNRKFQLLAAWIPFYTGAPDEAMAELQRIKQECEEASDWVALSSICYVMGAFQWQVRNIEESVHYLQLCDGIREEHGIEENHYMVKGMLASCSFERAQYSTASKLSQEAIKLSEGKPGSQWLHERYLIIAESLLRMRDFDKSLLWQQRAWLELFRRPADERVLFMTLSQAFLHIECGQFDEAKDIISRVSSSIESKGSPNLRGIYHRHQAWLALYRGDRAGTVREAEKAVEAYQSVPNHQGTQEAALVSELSRYLNDDSPDTATMLTRYRGLAKEVSIYHAAFALYFALLSSTGEELDYIVREVGVFMRANSKSKNTLFVALRKLASVLGTHGWSHLEVVQMLKDSLVQFDDGRLTLLAYFVSKKIADVYILRQNPRLAIKYLKNCERLARTMGNEPVQERIKARVSDLVPDSDRLSQLMRSMYRVSELLHSADNYYGALEELVRFAVDETGAERGALLMPKGDDHALRVVASYACDRESFADIQRISSSVPERVLEDAEPLVIDNAVMDKRTKSFRSIIRLNILSVMAVPLRRADEVVGVLYLDHHTIPALFDKSDYTYVKSMSNFITSFETLAGSFRTVKAANLRLLDELGRTEGTRPFVYRDQSISDIFEQLPNIASSRLPVLIVGESGTGKDVLAEIIHRLSARKDRPFVRMNCAAIPETMIEAELFGVNRGAATETAARDGRLHQADDGTLLLDEIGDMPFKLQSRLLRAVENQEFYRVGSDLPTYTDIRFIYATNQDLKDLINRKRFRADLYHRINTLTIRIPPLRERKDDIRPLVDYFLSIYQGRAVRIPEMIIDVFKEYSWPGNVRELKSEIERLCVKKPGLTVSIEDLSADIQEEYHAVIDPESQNSNMESRLRWVMKKTNNNQSRAAAILGMPRNTLRYQLKKHGFL